MGEIGAPETEPTAGLTRRQKKVLETVEEERKRSARGARYWQQRGNYFGFTSGEGKEWSLDMIDAKAWKKIGLGLVVLYGIYNSL